MSEIKELVDEYISITGRPAALLQVSEYLELKKYAEKRSSKTAHIKDPKDTHSSPQKDRQPIPFIDDDEDAEYEEYAAEHSKNIAKIEDRASKEPKDEKVNMPDKKAVSPALMMLRSIGG